MAFRQLKEALLDATTLAFPIAGTPCVLATDASDVAIGAVLPMLLKHQLHSTQE